MTRKSEYEHFMMKIRNISNRFSTVVHPEHPFLFKGPSALVASRGKLVAIFFPDHSERASIDRLLARLGAAKIALPIHTLFICVLNNHSSDLNAYMMHFDSTINLRDLDRVDLFKIKRESSQQNESLRFLKKRSYNISRICMEITTKYFIENELSSNVKTAFKSQFERYGYSRAYVPFWSQNDYLGGQRGFLSKIYSSEGNPSLLISTRSLGVRLTTHIRQLSVLSLRFQNNMDKGILYPKELNGLFLIANSHILQEFDLTRINRILAFSGICILNPRTRNEIEEAFMSYKKMLSKEGSLK